MLRYLGIVAVCLVVFGLALGITGCTPAPTTKPAADRMSGDKMQGDKMQGGKMGGDKMGGDKMGGDKMEGK